MDNYEYVIRDILHNKLPLYGEELKNYHKIAKESALAIFKK